MESLFIKACSFIKRLQHSCFPVNIAIFLRKPILKNILERLQQYLYLLCILLPGAWYICLLFQVTEGGAWYSECLKWHKIDEGIADHNHAKLKVKDHEKHE